MWTICTWHRLRLAIARQMRFWDALAADPRVQFLMLLQAALRGSNYFLDPPPPGSANTLSLTEESLPLWCWGGLYLTFAVLAIVGLNKRQWPLLQIGHFGVGMVYVAFAFGASVEYIRGESDGNFRTGTGFFFVALIHFIFAKKSESASRRARLREAGG